MKKTSYRISVASPCHEDWNAMLPEEKGKFCNACQKKVIDFSRMTDHEIASFIHPDSAICGRFLNSQLDRVIALLPTQNRVPMWKAVALFIWTLLLFRHPSAAQVKQVPKTEQLNPTMGKPVYIPAHNHPKILLKGIVKDSFSNKPMGGALVIVYHKQKQIYKTVTDTSGHFKIAIKYVGEISVGCHISGYEPVMINHISHSKKDMVFRMKSDIIIDKVPLRTTGLMVAEPDTTRKKK